MKRLIASIALSFVLVAVCAPPAAAGRHWWAWVEELSGPGPYGPDNGGAGNFLFDFERVACYSSSASRFGSAYSPARLKRILRQPVRLRNSSETEACGREDYEVPVYLSFRSSTFKSDGQQNAERWGPGTVRKIELLAYLRVDVPRLHMPFDLGTGLGQYRFAGNGPGSAGAAYDNVNKLMFPVRVRFAPTDVFLRKSNKWRGIARAFYFEGGFDYIPGRIEASEFRSPVSYANSGVVVIPTYRFTINALTLLGI